MLDKLKECRGAVLLEFAFAIPILVMVIYCSLDLPNAYRVSLKLQKTSEVYAHMLMNIRRSGDKAITMSDLQDISKSIGVTFSGMIKNQKNCPFYLSTYIICIKGVEDNSFENKWSVHVKNNISKGEITSSVDSMYSTIMENSIQFLGNTKNFSIQKGEIKLVIESVVWYEDESRGFNDKFHMFKMPAKIKSSAKTFGDKNAVITPPYGMVNDKPPIKDGTSEESDTKSI